MQAAQDKRTILDKLKVAIKEKDADFESKALEVLSFLVYEIKKAGIDGSVSYNLYSKFGSNDLKVFNAIKTILVQDVFFDNCELKYVPFRPAQNQREEDTGGYLIFCYDK